MSYKTLVATSLVICLGVLFMAPVGHAKEPVRVLFLTKSQGFQHSVITRNHGEFGLAEKVMLDLGKKNNLQVVVTKDAGMINAKQLEQFDVVQFYTTGDLTQPGNDQAPVMSSSSVDELYNWVKQGGGFAGMHTAADTLKSNTTYRKLSGGVFKTHGKQEVAELKVKQHPITSHLKPSWTIHDEWYIFKDVTNTFQPLIILNTKSMKQEIYTSISPYPNTWIEEIGEGRAFNTALGHREDVWTNPDFQQLIVKGIKWAAKQL